MRVHHTFDRSARSTTKGGPTSGPPLLSFDLGHRNLGAASALLPGLRNFLGSMGPWPVRGPARPQGPHLSSGAALQHYAINRLRFICARSIRRNFTDLNVASHSTER